MIQKVILLFNTCKKLKSVQIFYQVYYRVKKTFYLVDNKLDVEGNNIDFICCYVESNIKRIDYNTFNFLNIIHSFDDAIDWNFMEYGKLWNYNLEYFNYLDQEDLTIDRKVELINDFYDFSIKNKRVLEPYPVSLRSINIIKFATKEGLNKEFFIGYTYQELQFLHANYEYHILGNHLLENCFAMILGGAFFDEQTWLNKAKRTLYKELEEQVLEDGAHFELSPMYHQIILYRVLELIDWYAAYSDRDEVFLAFLREKASKMLSWLEQISFRIGDIPLFNDAANGITYDTSRLLHYANVLSISSKKIPLGKSGYRSYQGINYEIKVDYAQVGASYQPGHSHADALGFILYYKNKPLFVEAGTSTYQIGKQRNYERSTIAHNTVVVNGLNQSEVWGGFRLGKRAKTYIEHDEKNRIKGYHDGYKHTVGNVYREFILEDNQVVIIDAIEKSKGECKVYFHLSEYISVLEKNDSTLILSNGVSIYFENAINFNVIKSTYAEEYNIYKEGITIIVDFVSSLKTTITLL
ncbi:alginate lyase family protein [Myroides odoratimimus]|uniref:alginate lyase family protein n=1 Tax=Myroides odoratimimus TaxID=76832 RepID=UPI002575AC0F|nr:alginate lyase family protein [Myroides odoratimimus]MDM1412152.1 alginate lyase family protein [Myroides odoratimimus]